MMKMKDRELVYKKIPDATIDHYISGFEALNIADLIYHEYETYPFRFQNIVEEFLSEEERLQLFGYLLEIQQERNIEEFLIQEFPKEYYELNSDDQLEQREK